MVQDTKPARAARRCRVCGCTDDAACQVGGFYPCIWIDKNLCSACAPLKEVLQHPAGRQWLFSFTAAEMTAIFEQLRVGAF